MQQILIPLTNSSFYIKMPLTLIFDWLLKEERNNRLLKVGNMTESISFCGLELMTNDRAMWNELWPCQSGSTNFLPQGCMQTCLWLQTQSGSALLTATLGTNVKQTTYKRESRDTWGRGITLLFSILFWARSWWSLTRRHGGTLSSGLWTLVTVF